MKPSLQLKLSQQLALTPQLQQAIKLLQLSTLEMNQEIERYLLENPLLERAEDAEEENGGVMAYGGVDYEPAYADNQGEGAAENAKEAQSPEGISQMDIEEDRWLQDSGNYGNPARDQDDDTDAHDLHAATTSLRDHLLWQLGLSRFSDQERALVRFLIEALDENGYLTASLEDLLETLLPELPVDLGSLEAALEELQSFDPTGIGARSAKECLSLQLKALEQSAARDLALVVVDQSLDLLASKEFGKIKKQLECDDESLKAAHALIMGLDPHPGASYAPLDTRYIIPDVLVRKVRGRWVAQINPDAYPRLRVNRLYADILSRQQKKEVNMSAQLQEARWLVKNVQQRFETIARVSQTIVKRQNQFFEHGEVAMRPLVLREVADEIGMHESTVSRVTNQKYMATPRGIFELKYFFGSYVATDTGGACSATAIRALIKQLVGGEDRKNPLSDNQISELLGRQGIVVARRTIAKYREALNIPPVSQRKTL